MVEADRGSGRLVVVGVRHVLPTAAAVAGLATGPKAVTLNVVLIVVPQVLID